MIPNAVKTWHVDCLEKYVYPVNSDSWYYLGSRKPSDVLLCVPSFSDLFYSALFFTMPDLLRTYKIIVPSVLFLPQATLNGSLQIQDHIEHCGDDHYGVQLWCIHSIFGGFQLNFAPILSNISNRNTNVLNVCFRDTIYLHTKKRFGKNLEINISLYVQ